MYYGVCSIEVISPINNDLLSLLPNGHDSVSNHQPYDCLLNRLFRRRSKKTSKLRITGLCVGNSPVTGESPAQMASNAENVSIWWPHHVVPYEFYELYIPCYQSAHGAHFYGKAPLYAIFPRAGRLVTYMCAVLVHEQWCFLIHSWLPYRYHILHNCAVYPRYGVVQNNTVFTTTLQMTTSIGHK